jgi:phage terminase large subunit-like protein
VTATQAEKIDQLRKLAKLKHALRFVWSCGVPGCDGRPGHRLPGTKVLIPFRHARAEQLPPIPSWYVWALITGRGFGKTRTGAEYVKKRMLEDPGHRVACIVPTFGDGRDICVEGESGLRGMVEDEGAIPWNRIKIWNRSIGELVLTNGSMLKIFGTHDRKDAESLRGWQCGTAWFEELGTQQYGDVAWDMLEFALRLGDDPRIVVTTTPRKIPIIKRLLKEDEDPESGTVVTRGSTMSNAENLPAAMLARLRLRYEGTTLGQQELMGLLLEDTLGALWTQDDIDRDRASAAPGAFDRIVIGVDPAGSHRKTSDETGIVPVGLLNGHVYPLEDLSRRYSPEQWADVAVRAYHRHKADAIVVEKNFGGDMVISTLRNRDAGVHVRAVTASRGKAIRAEPIVNLYERRMAHHVGWLGDLESQMVTWVPPGQFEVDERTGISVAIPASPESPDRLDALVWAVTDLTQRRERTISPD